MVREIVASILIVLAVLYLSSYCVLRSQQARLIFFPNSEIESTPQDYDLSYQDVWLDVGQERVHGWWVPAAQASAPALLYFHGNGSNNGDHSDIAALFHQLDLAVLLIDYRGYGRSSQIFPSEASVYEDAEAAWQYLIEQQQLKPEQILAYGHSLGGAIAIELATKHPDLAGLIVEGTFTSIRAMASLTPALRLFPLSWLITQRFDSIAKIESLKMPILLLHGKQDDIVPSYMSAELFAAASEPKQLEFFPEAGHNNLPELNHERFLTVLRHFIELAQSDRVDS